MFPYTPLIVKQLLTELHHEAEMNRRLRVADQKKPSRMSLAFMGFSGLVKL